MGHFQQDAFGKEKKYWLGCSLRRRDPARPLMTVTGFLESVQNCSSTGEKASLLLSSWK